MTCGVCGAHKIGNSWGQQAPEGVKLPFNKLAFTGLSSVVDSVRTTGVGYDQSE